MRKYTITDEDFNRCIGDWLNADNSNFQAYAQGIKLFHDYLDERYPEANKRGNITPVNDMQPSDVAESTDVTNAQKTN